MKKKYLILACVLLLGIFSAGCGKKKEEVPEAPQVTETPTPTPTPVAEEKNPNLVDMQQITQEAEKNVMGTKTAASGKLVIYNKTGSEISSIFIRRSPEDSESGDRDWGADLVDGRFKLANGDRAVYYYEKGTSQQLYDIQIRFTDTNASECYFRMLPMNDITQISLCMEGMEDSAIPYARYVSSTSKREISTLNDVMKRLGLVEDESDDTPTPAPEPTEAPEITEPPADDDGDGEDEPDPQAEQAENYIGMSLDDLIAAMGEPNGASYEDEPETGETGYHYYDSFTVSTTVDEEGNEVVAGIW